MIEIKTEQERIKSNKIFGQDTIQKDLPHFTKMATRHFLVLMMLRHISITLQLSIDTVYKLLLDTETIDLTNSSDQKIDKMLEQLAKKIAFNQRSDNKKPVIMTILVEKNRSVVLCLDQEYLYYQKKKKSLDPTQGIVDMIAQQIDKKNRLTKGWKYLYTYPKFGYKYKAAINVIKMLLVTLPCNAKNVEPFFKDLEYFNVNLNIDFCTQDNHLSSTSRAMLSSIDDFPQQIERMRQKNQKLHEGLSFIKNLSTIFRHTLLLEEKIPSNKIQEFCDLEIAKIMNLINSSEVFYSEIPIQDFQPLVESNHESQASIYYFLEQIVNYYNQNPMSKQTFWELTREERIRVSNEYFNRMKEYFTSLAPDLIHLFDPQKIDIAKLQTFILKNYQIDCDNQELNQIQLFFTSEGNLPHFSDVEFQTYLQKAPSLLSSYLVLDKYQLLYDMDRFLEDLYENSKYSGQNMLVIQRLIQLRHCVFYSHYFYNYITDNQGDRRVISRELQHFRMLLDYLQDYKIAFYDNYFQAQSPFFWGRSYREKSAELPNDPHFEDLEAKLREQYIKGLSSEIEENASLAIKEKVQTAREKMAHAHALQKNLPASNRFRTIRLDSNYIFGTTKINQEYSDLSFFARHQHQISTLITTILIGGTVYFLSSAFVAYCIGVGDSSPFSAFIRSFEIIISALSTVADSKLESACIVAFVPLAFSILCTIAGIYLLKNNGILNKNAQYEFLEAALEIQQCLEQHPQYKLNIIEELGRHARY